MKKTVCIFWVVFCVLAIRLADTQKQNKDVSAMTDGTNPEVMLSVTLGDIAESLFEKVSKK